MASKVPPSLQAEKSLHTPNSRKKAAKAEPVVVVESASVGGYTSEGVKNNDIFQLPGSDWQLLGLLTVLSAVVRLFRIFQPSSVVFDEVQ